MDPGAFEPNDTPGGGGGRVARLRRSAPALSGRRSRATATAVENGWHRGRTGLSSRQDEGRLRIFRPRNVAGQETEATSMTLDRTKFVLDEDRIPRSFYNIAADLPEPPPPPLHPGTGQPIGPQDLAPLFPMELIKQVVSQERWIGIPEEVRDILRLWRPSQLHRAHRLERALDTPARIY